MGYRPFKGTITLPADTNQHNLLDCLQAVAGAGTGGDAGSTRNYCEWILIADENNAGNLHIGIGGVSTTIYGIKLLPLGSWSIGSGNVLNNKCPSDYYILGSANSQKFHFTGSNA